MPDAPSNRTRLGRVGIWSMELRFGGDAGLAAEAAAELDALGYGAIWIPGGVGGDVAGDVNRLLAATSRATIATGIINIWKHTPQEIGDWWASLSVDHQSRLLLGIGASHGPLIGDDYVKPLTAMRNFLDGLAAHGVPVESATCLAALAPKMLGLARDRTAGSHPYLVTPEHSAIARAALGPDKLLAPEQGVVLETDPVKARQMALAAVDHYRQLPNYVNNWLRLGFTQEEIDSGSDRFIDGIFAWGDAGRIKERVDAHIAAGADHVCLQVIHPGGMDVAGARPIWRELAAALL
jgi:probable F420-dependent oxidoreductase